LVEQAEALQNFLLREAKIPHAQENDDLPDIDFTGETRIALVKQRVKQSFFRRSVLSSYGGKCCVSGVSDARFSSPAISWLGRKTLRFGSIPPMGFASQPSTTRLSTIIFFR
jgi:hypothetical protein